MVIARFYIGDLQGVEYRPFILEQIFNFDLNGAPKNLLDGRIEVVVEGEREDIEDFYEYLKAKMPPPQGIHDSARLNLVSFMLWIGEMLRWHSIRISGTPRYLW